MENKKYPAFVIPYFSNSSEVQIPPPFASFMKGELDPGKITLTSNEKESWVLEVAKNGDDLYFEYGWIKFTQDNLVDFGDLLVFQYKGDNLFEFKILGKTASQKEIIQMFDFNVKEGGKERDMDEKEEAGYKTDLHMEEADDEITNKKMPIRKRKISGIESEEKERGVNKEKEAGKKTNFNREELFDFNLNEEGLDMNEEETGNNLNFSKDELFDLNLNNGGRNMEPEEKTREVEREKVANGETGNKANVHKEELNNETSNKKVPKRKGNFSGASSSKIKKSKNHKPIVAGSPKMEAKGKELVAVPKIHLKEDDDLFETGYMNDNPYFTTRIKAVRKSSLHIPHEIIKDDDVKIRETVTLRDPHGRTWSAKTTVWKDGRVWLKGGWKELCKRNSLQVGDWCVCEVKPGKGRKGSFIQVHFQKTELRTPRLERILELEWIKQENAAGNGSLDLVPAENGSVQRV